MTNPRATSDLFSQKLTENTAELRWNSLLENRHVEVFWGLEAWASAFTVNSDVSGAQETPAVSEVALIRLPQPLHYLLKTEHSQITTVWPCPGWKWSARWEIMMNYMVVNQKPPSWCTIITLTGVTLFHFNLTTDLHSTMHPADVQIPPSFLQGWGTPHLSSLPQHKHTSEADVCVGGRDLCHRATRTVTATVFRKATAASSIIHTVE